MPGTVKKLVEQARKSIAATIGVEPDFTAETLPLADEYISRIVVKEPSKERTKLLMAVGCYFGEVVRRKLGARWRIQGDSASTWRLEFTRCFLHFSPVGVAAEIMTGCESEEYDGTFETLDKYHEALHERLEQAPPLSEDEYFSLAGRFEIINLVADFLVGLAIKEGQEPKTYTKEDYESSAKRKIEAEKQKT
ncbi:MAG: hypothetical protein V1754_12960 [Pseudomonadota bacterium]